MNETRESNLLSISQAARRLNISKPTAYRRIWEGSLPAYRLGSSGPLRVDAAELEAWLVRQRVPSPGKGDRTNRLDQVSAVALTTPPSAGPAAPDDSTVLSPAASSGSAGQQGGHE